MPRALRPSPPILALAVFAALGCSSTREGSQSVQTGPAVAQASGGDSDPLPSWEEGRAKDAILAFVARVTARDDPGFVPPSERIVTFDNDGTLWPEQPIYAQVAFTLDRLTDFVGEHPYWGFEQPFKAVLERDWPAVAATGEAGRLELLAAAYAGMTTAEFDSSVTQWIATARHPRFDRPYTDLAYRPMLELMSYLRAHDFKIFIVSGGGVDFMRPWTERVYGVPPERVVGSRIKLQYEDDAMPSIRRLPVVDLVDDRSGKPIGIQQTVGRRPIAAFGNSDGDFEMLDWTTSGSGVRLGVLVHHTDAKREWAYDRHSKVGKLSYALDQAAERGWIVIDMKRDWRELYTFAH